MNLDVIKARLGSLSKVVRRKIANVSPAARGSANTDGMFTRAGQESISR